MSGWRHAVVAVLSAAATAAAEGPETEAPAAWRVRNPDLYGVDAQGDRVWAVGYWGTILRSGDGGGTWSAVRPGVRETLFGVSFADGERGWAVGENGLVLRTDDAGEHWSRQRVALPEDSAAGLELDTHLFDVVAVSAREAWAVGDLGVVLHTRDGERWNLVPLPDGVFADGEVPDRILNGVDFADRDHGWIVGEFGTTLRTTDGGASWRGNRRIEGAPPDLYLFDVAARDAARVAAVGLGGTVLVTTDGGETWRSERAPSTAGLYAVEWRTAPGAVVGDRGEVFRGDGASGRWLPVRRPTLFNWLAGVASAGSGRLYAVGEKGLVLRSDDAGQSWRQLHGREPLPISAVSVPEPRRRDEDRVDGIRLLPGPRP